MKENRTTTCYVTTLYFFKHPIENYFLFHDELGTYAYLCYALFRGTATVGMVPTPSGRPSKKKKKKRRSLEDARMCAIWRRRRRKLPPSDLVFPSKVRKRRGGNPTADNPFHRQTGWERKRKRDRRILSASVSGKRGGGMTYRVSFPQFPTNVWANRRSKSLIFEKSLKKLLF